jgi:hypothetical protein
MMMMMMMMMMMRRRRRRMMMMMYQLQRSYIMSSLSRKILKYCLMVKG